MQALDRFLRGGELGKLTGIRAGVYQPRMRHEGWRARRAEAGGGAFFDQGCPCSTSRCGSPTSRRRCACGRTWIAPRGASGRGVGARQLECDTGVAFTFDISWAYVGDEERWWFETLSSRGSARLAPLRVVKELNGKPTDVSPGGAAARESAFIQSYRAELAHFLAVVREETPYEPPTDQVDRCTGSSRRPTSRRTRAKRSGL